GFGAAVAIWANTVIVGAPGVEGTPGSAHVFVREDGAWREEAVLAANDGQPGDGFGSAVALAGDTAIIGAPGAQGSAGAAYVFARRNFAWTLQAKLVSASNQPGERFGAAVAAARDLALVGAPAAGNGAAGNVAVFRRDRGVWTRTMLLAASDGQPGDG